MTEIQQGTNQSQLQTSPASLPREVVAVVLTYRGRVGLFKRGLRVGSDVGRWHCITGYIDEAASATGQAYVELHEETGLEIRDIKSLLAGEVLSLDDQNGEPWHVHTFLATTNKRKLRLNWEHDTYRWVPYRRVSRFDGQVEWLSHVLAVFADDILEGLTLDTTSSPASVAGGVPRVAKPEGLSGSSKSTSRLRISGRQLSP
jgi:ADP-ribose pyrophosphatase YjhB (NUDIX family)